VSDDERPDTLADQAAAWVPPWERQQRPPDRAYQAAAEEVARRVEAGEDPESADDEELSEAGLSDDDDDFDEEFEGANPPGYHEPDGDDATASLGGVDEEDADDGPERAAFGDDGSVSVDAPVEAEVEVDEPEPTAAEIGPDLDVPDAVEEAVEDEGEPDGVPADAPVPAGGDDAGSVFDGAADDDVDDDEVDLPVAGEPEDAAEAQRERAAVPEQARGRRDGAGAVGGVDARTAQVAEPDDLPDLADEAELTAALEAILLVVDEPVAEMQLAQILEQPTERVGMLLENISARYTAAGHGFDLRRAAGGWRLYTRPEYAAYVERFVLDGQSVRLTQAALETLAVVAYKQPVTRSRISAIRGVNCDGVMRTLATRGLIEECGVEGETGAHLYRTTDLFLEKLGLNSVDQLPPLAPFLPDDVEEVLDAPG
jgi:segregation and condensation protein B